MLGRAFSSLISATLLLGAVSGCDNSPKYVLPASQVPPHPPLQVGGAGGAPANPAPEAEPREKLPYPKDLPLDSTPPENRK
jgi:hypothetical protein